MDSTFQYIGVVDFKTFQWTKIAIVTFGTPNSIAVHEGQRSVSSRCNSAFYNIMHNLKLIINGEICLNILITICINKVGNFMQILQIIH